METPRLIIIDNLANGTSAITEDRNLTPFWQTEDGHKTTELFYLNQLPPIAPFAKHFQDQFDFNLSPGTLRFSHSVIPPFSQVKTCYEKNGLTADENQYGRHNTTTIDFLVLTKGVLDLVTENGTVRLQVGDCVVQKVTVHAWINPGKEPAELVYIMIGAIVPKEFKSIQPESSVPTQIEYPFT